MTGSESVSQLIVALTSLAAVTGGDAVADFDVAAYVSALVSFQTADGRFRHVTTGGGDQMATEQAAYALAAYGRFVTGKPALYDMAELFEDNSGNGGETALPFADIDENGGEWYNPAVRYVYEHKLMNGTSADMFSPGGELTRAMLVTILWRHKGSPIAVNGAVFSDVSPGEWYSDPVAWASANGIVNGIGDDLFAPDDSITREQLAAFLYRCAGLGDGWGGAALAWSQSAGIMNDGRGQDTATRAEAAVMLRRFIENVLNSQV
jgi:hypothetical protein